MAHVITVSDPGYWWRATPADVALTDPTAEGHHHGKPPVNWLLVAYTVEELGRDLVFDTADPVLPPTSRLFRIDRDLPELELGIVQAWFGRNPPKTDPGGLLTNGRHRLSGAWGAAPTLALPIRSDILWSASDESLTPALEAARNSRN